MGHAEGIFPDLLAKIPQKYHRGITKDEITVVGGKKLALSCLRKVAEFYGLW